MERERVGGVRYRGGSGRAGGRERGCEVEDIEWRGRVRASVGERGGEEERDRGGRRE